MHIVGKIFIIYTPDSESSVRILPLPQDHHRTGSQLAPCGGCGQPVGGVHRCPGCGAHMHPFCGDPVGEEGYGQMIRCPGCR